MNTLLLKIDVVQNLNLNKDIEMMVGRSNDFGSETIIFIDLEIDVDSLAKK